MGALRALAGAGQHPTDFQKTFMDSRCIRMPITHNTPKACVGIVEQCLGLNQVAEGGGACGIDKRDCILRGGFARLGKPEFFNSQKRRATRTRYKRPAADAQ